MKEDEDIEAMYSRFQTLVSGLQDLKKSYSVPDHVKNILRILPTRFEPKVTTIQKAKDLDKLSFENLISSLKSYDIELDVDEPIYKSTSISLTSKVKSITPLNPTINI